MGHKIIRFSTDGRARMLRGVEILAETVGLTLGPGGRNVMLDRQYHPPLSTKDGVTVARDMAVSGKIGDMALQIVKLAAESVSEVAGDGTTTTTVLTHAILVEAHKRAAAGHDPMAIKRGIEAAATQALDALEAMARPLKGKKQVAAVASVASNGDETVAAMVAEAFEKVGRDGVIAVEEANFVESRLVTVEGMEIERGYLSAHFVTNAVSREAVLENCRILLWDAKIDHVKDLLPLVSQIAQAKQSLLVIAEDVRGEALQLLVQNKVRGVLKCAAMKLPEWGVARLELRDDLAAVLGGQAFTRDMGVSLEKLPLSTLGRADKITMGPASTLITGGKGKKADIEARVRRVRKMLEDRELNEHDREKFEKRLAKLAGGVSVIYVGGVNEIEMKERVARAQNATCAVRAALHEGFLPGGGVALARAALAVDEKKLPLARRPGAAILKRALEEPLRRIVRNAGDDPAVVIERVRKAKPGTGYDARTGELVDVARSDILDPLKVVRLALQTAASVAGMLVTADVMIAESPFQPDDSEELNPPMPEAYK